MEKIMRIVGLGTDIVEIARLQDAVSRHEEHFLNRIYTPAELLAAGKDSPRISYCAGRWAAKEAAAKALGTGIGESCAFNEIEILYDPAGRPVMTISGSAAATAGAFGVSEIKVSISHEKNYAVAVVILSGEARS